MYIESIYENLVNRSQNNAVCLDEEHTTYGQLLKKVNGIRAFIRKVVPADVKGLGLVAYSHPDTYAAIIAYWLEGKYYIPLLPFAPIERNKSVVSESGMEYLFGRTSFGQELNIRQFSIDQIDDADDTLPYDPSIYHDGDLAYLLFTSGSTGKPKGVPITYSNLDSFIHSMYALGHDLNENDRCLQMFELTFDFSVASYVLPIYAGACIYIIPEGEIKASYALDLLEEYHLTVLDLVPSVLTYLKRFFDELDIQETRLCSFCGEALLDDITAEWQKCIPNCRIINFYGPTENTVFCTYYDFKAGCVKSHNGVVSIGKDMPSTFSVVLNDKDEECAPMEEGELCLAGPQLTPGYWDKQSNSGVFFDYKGQTCYRTGDLVYKDSEGDLMYIGRKDFQAKIQGFRVELSEIEHFAKSAVESQPDCVCVAYQEKGLTQIGLAVESKPIDESLFIDFIKSKLPPYEVPAKVLFFDSFPHNQNGKIDRKIIIKRFENE